MSGDVVLIDQPFDDQRVHNSVVKGDVGAGLNLREVRAEVGEVMTPNVDHDQLRALLRGVLHERCRDRVIGRGVAAGDQGDAGTFDIGEDVGHGARADGFHQSRDRRRVTKPRAVVDVVGSEGAADQLLKQVGFFVRVFGRSKSGKRVAAMFVADAAEFLSNQVEGFVPGCFAEGRHDFGIVDDSAGATAD